MSKGVLSSIKTMFKIDITIQMIHAFSKSQNTCIKRCQDTFFKQISSISRGSLPSNTEKNPRDINAILAVNRSQVEPKEKTVDEEEAMEPIIEKGTEDAPKHVESSPTGKKGTVIRGSIRNLFHRNNA
ncbi:uncharacterized protein [Henckelia pumila]|uniref:uncharacterized protein n=1 Tax=Henckelia pumila TaxID=405737 RepID=UPI003C6DB99F